MKSCGVARLENFLWTRLGFPGDVVVKNPPASAGDTGDSGLIPRLGISSVQLLSHVRLFATHGLQHARLPCFSPTPRAYSNSCPLSRWCHSVIWSSVVPFSRLESSPASESFPQSQFFASGGQSIGVSALASVLLMNIQDWFPLGWTGWISLQCKGLSRVFSNNTVQKHQFFSTQLPLYTTLIYVHDYWKNHGFD